MKEARAEEPRIEITEYDLVSAMMDARRARLTDRPPGYYTVTEMAARSGQAARSVRDRIGALRRQGLVEQAVVWIEGIDGRVTRATAYRLLRRDG